MPTLPTPDEALAALKAQPGIDLTKQKEGTRILVETDSELFEIKTLQPAKCLIEISGTAPELRQPTVGQYLRGVYVLNAGVAIENRIGRTMQMLIRFRNGNFLSGPVVTATVSGPGWQYNVF